MYLKTAVYAAVIALFANPVAIAAPATVVEAAEKLDLMTLPLPTGAEQQGHRRAAELNYKVKQSAGEAFDFVDKQLTDRKWKQLPGATNQGGFASGDYQLDGYRVHLSVFPQQPGVAYITLTHFGNVALEDVPVPKGVKKSHAFTSVVMYKSPDSVEETAAACREKLLAAGWSPYGGAGDTAYYRQNAVQVDINVMSAPAQNNATVITVTSKLLSLEIPAPPFADDVRYSDGTTVLDFDTDKSPQEVADFYREKLSPLGWKATTDEPVAIRWKKFTIFRNPGQEMLTIETHDFEGRTRVKVDHENASEVATEELRTQIAFGEKAKYRDKPWIDVEITIPARHKSEKLEDWALKIPTPKEKAFAVADEIATSLTANGWELDGKPSDSPVIRSQRFTKQDRVIRLITIKAPKLDSWVAIVGIHAIKLKPLE